MTVYIEPFDLKNIIIGYFLGSHNLFYFAFVIIFAFACAKYQMPDKYFLLLLGAGSIMFGVLVGEAMFVILLFIIGFVTFKPLAAVFNRA